MRAVRCLKNGILLLAFGVLGGTAQAEIEPTTGIRELMQGGKPDQALALVEARLAKTSDSFQLRYLKALALLDLERFAESLTLLDSLIQESPRVAELYNNRGFAQARRKQYSKAILDFEEAIRLNPSYALAHENLGLVYAVLAELALGQAQQLDKDNVRTAARYARMQAFNQDKSVESAAPGESTADPALLPDSAAAAAVGKALEAWRAAWEGQDMAAYFAAYLPDYKAAGFSTVQAWRADREQKIARQKGPLTVELDKVTMTFSGDDVAEVNCQQTYRNGKLELRHQKNLLLLKKDGRWLIEQEKTLYEAQALSKKQLTESVE